MRMDVTANEKVWLLVSEPSCLLLTQVKTRDATASKNKKSCYCCCYLPDLHPVVCRVVVTGTGEAAGLQELVGGVHLAQEGRPALRHEEDLVEHLHQVAAGLVDGADDSPALAGQSPQCLHHSGRHEAVQAGGGLVTEHDAGVGQHLTCQRQSLPLSPGYSLLALVLLPYHRVRAFGQPELESNGVHSSVLHPSYPSPHG